MWIKVCGLGDAAGVDAALAAGADAIGWVFAESPRKVLPAHAARLAAPARGRSAIVAVTLHPSQAIIDEILEVLRPDILQSDAEDLATLRLPRQLQRLPVLRDGQRTREGAEGALPPRLLFEGSHSGSGATADWSQAGRLARRTELILAGGLHAHNIAAAIRDVRPFGVDVSSGVESAPGLKSPAMIAEFVSAARAAAEGRA